MPLFLTSSSSWIRGFKRNRLKHFIFKVVNLMNSEFYICIEKVNSVWMFGEDACFLLNSSSIGTWMCFELKCVPEVYFSKCLRHTVFEVESGVRNNCQIYSKKYRAWFCKQVSKFSNYLTPYSTVIIGGYFKSFFLYSNFIFGATFVFAYCLSYEGVTSLFRRSAIQRASCL